MGVDWRGIQAGWGEREREREREREMSDGWKMGKGAKMGIQ